MEFAGWPWGENGKVLFCLTVCSGPCDYHTLEACLRPLLCIELEFAVRVLMWAILAIRWGTSRAVVWLGVILPRSFTHFCDFKLIGRHQRPTQQVHRWTAGVGRGNRREARLAGD